MGRKTRANPILARLLRQIECLIHGVRIIRLPGHRFRAELSEEPARDAAGKNFMLLAFSRPADLVHGVECLVELLLVRREHPPDTHDAPVHMLHCRGRRRRRGFLPLWL